MSYVQDWNGWWLAVVRDRPAGKLNGELQALPISVQSSPQVWPRTRWLDKRFCTNRHYGRQTGQTLLRSGSSSLQLAWAILSSCDVELA